MRKLKAKEAKPAPAKATYVFREDHAAKPIRSMLKAEKRATKMERPTILIVDDDLDLLRGLNVRLRAGDYDTACATDGPSAITMAGKVKPNLILLDLSLPAQDGFAVMDQLRQDADLARIPIIVLTARDPQSSKAQSLQAGAVGFFQKPVDNAVLLDAIRTTLGSA